METFDHCKTVTVIEGVTNVNQESRFYPELMETLVFSVPETEIQHLISMFTMIIFNVGRFT